MQKDWPTLHAFKEKVWEALESEAPTFVPTNQFFYDLLSRLSHGEFTVRSASGLDDLRYEVTPNMIYQHFDCLNSLELQTVDPRLVISVDETGFGQSVSGRAKPPKVIVPKLFDGSPVYRVREEKRYIYRFLYCRDNIVRAALDPGTVPFTVTVRDIIPQQPSFQLQFFNTT